MQDNVFTHVCHSVHGGDLVPSMQNRSHDRGVCIQAGQGLGGLCRPPSEIHEILRVTANKRVVRVLLELILVESMFSFEKKKKATL